MSRRPGRKPAWEHEEPVPPLDPQFRKLKRTRGTHCCTQQNIGSEYTEDEVEFLRAMTRYQQLQRRPFPTFAEALAIAKSLGWRKQ